jgi:hypothetical protein
MTEIILFASIAAIKTIITPKFPGKPLGIIMIQIKTFFQLSLCILSFSQVKIISLIK